jgi:acetyl esterase/lipase
MSDGLNLSARSFGTAEETAEIRGFNTAMLEGMAGVGWAFPPASVDALRGLAGANPYRSDRARTLTVPSPEGGIPIRVIDAERPRGIYLHCHPGGWTIGSSEVQDAALEAIVAATGLTAVSIEYRLAPEHPYPAGLDDCERVARWVAEQGGEELGADLIVLAGESAGANLALCTMLRLKDDPAGAHVRGGVLLYGNYDLTMTPSQRAATSGVLITAAALEWFYDQYVPDRGLRGHPDVSPLFADLGGLPPVHLAVGGRDSLLDDTVFLAARMVAAGVDCTLDVVPGGEHSFDMAPVQAARDAVARTHAFLAARADELAAAAAA